MRRYIADVEKKVRKVEIYGRDNYVKKDEFVRATDSIRADIKALGAEIKSDLKGHAKRTDRQGVVDRARPDFEGGGRAKKCAGRWRHRPREVGYAELGPLGVK
ncbi:hypothetical protein [Bradyrhizobium australafricanum]|uniref:hypothetical protein n=1 Tax=Bradyrhizobium australafricanum TaxID=2821406 RepID=UPI001CE26253|nr:hypothetical protein [Bradyrhizobium australafricanum]MCA6104927.1 hypothetical protein [Bradyrhizobium australafricanum]